MNAYSFEPLLTWHQSLAAYEEHLAALGRSPSTREIALARIRAFANAVSCGPWETTSAQVAAFIDRGNSETYQRGLLTDLRSFYAWAARAGHRLSSPVPTRADRRSAKRKPKRIDPAWHEPVHRWETWCHAANRSPTTMRLRLHYLNDLAATFDDPWTISGDDLAEWMDRDEWGPETRRTARAAARAFYTWAVRTGRVEASPADELDPVRIPRALPRPASNSALSIALAGGTDRDRLMLMLGAYAGLRCMEIAAVHARDVRDRSITVTGKGGTQRVIPLHPDLQEEIRLEVERREAGGFGTGYRYTELIRADGYLFPGAFGAHIKASNVSEVLSKALGTDWTAHMLRHRFASQAYAVDRDLRAVQELLGHAKPETTARYAAVPDGALRSAVSGVGL